MKTLKALRGLIRKDKRTEAQEAAEMLATFENGISRAATPETILKLYYPEYKPPKCERAKRGYDFGEGLTWTPRFRSHLGQSKTKDLYICKKCGCDILI